MLSGKKLYSDSWEFYLSAGFLIVQGWMAAFGCFLVAIRILVIATIVGISCFTYLACILVADSAILLLVLCRVASPQLSWTVPSHHWLTILFSIMAGWLSLPVLGRNRVGTVLPMLTGLAAGAAAMVMSSRGAYIASQPPWLHSSVRDATRAK